MSASAGKLIILTAPSGSGKTSITRFLTDKYPQLTFSISATTRSPRGAEQNGTDYYFLSVVDFEQQIKENAFVEWVMVYAGKYYGTLKTELARIWNEQKVPMLDIDVEGAVRVQKKFPGQCLSIFIQPPSIDELRRRLESRGTESPANIATRIERAAYEISFSHEFNHIILNDDLEKACTDTEQLIKDFLGW